MKKVFFSSLLLVYICLGASAQSGTNSPYSQYGLGVLSDQSQGFNRGMSGLGYGLRTSNQVNVLNPASYSSIDSLTMIFDMGLSLQLTHFEENGIKKNARNANFEYAVATFRVFPKVGLSVGILPFTNIGYNYSTTEALPSSSTTVTQNCEGSGGLHQAYAGIGWNMFAGLSLGANFSYLWGDYEKSVTVSSNDSYVNTLGRRYKASISSYKIDLGMQYEQKIGRRDALVLGATVGLGHKLGADPSISISNTNPQTAVMQVKTDTVSNGLEIPLTIGGGLSYKHGTKWLLGVDYSLQKWGELSYPEVDDATQKYQLKKGLLKDRHKLTFGGQYVPRAYDTRHFLNRIHYRFGVSYATPYYNIGNVKGPKELTVSAGFGIPIFNDWTSHSMSNVTFLNISGQWVHTSAKDLITENTFRINVGITFNEQWFKKWKVK